MRLYRKKPVIIEAMQWDPDGALSAGELVGWMAAADFEIVGGPFTDEPISVAIRTLEGTMIAGPGDWIIKGVKGEFYPCKPDIFDATYEAVT